MDNLKLSLASIEGEREQLKRDIAQNEESCATIQGTLERIIRTAAASVSSKNDEGSHDKSSTLKLVPSNTSLDSIHEISITDDEISSDEDVLPKNLTPEVPNLDNFLSLVADGSIKLSDDVLLELQSLNRQATAAKNIASGFENRLSNLESTVEALKIKIEDLQSMVKEKNEAFDEKLAIQQATTESLKTC